MAQIKSKVVIALLVQLLYLLFPPFICPEQAVYPVIKELNRKDIFFLQLEEDVSLYYINSKSGKPIPPPVIYKYTVKTGETLYTIAARLNIPYESIALINRLDRPDFLGPGQDIFILNIPGLPIPLEPKNDLEILILSWRDLSSGIPINLSVKDGKTDKFLFLPGERFNSLELSYFLGILFKFPLRQGRVTSNYGYRQNPFVHGDISFHRGIDIAAPRGTEVFPAREGKVLEKGFDAVYGNYIIIGHAGGYETLYGHLEYILVQLNQTVSSSTIIGTVGSTGLSTGPHLHFEIRRNGETTDPSLLLPRIR